MPLPFDLWTLQRGFNHPQTTRACMNYFNLRFRVFRALPDQNLLLDRPSTRYMIKDKNRNDLTHNYEWYYYTEFARIIQRFENRLNDKVLKKNINMINIIWLIDYFNKKGAN